MAEDLGKKLLAEVEEVGLDELLHLIRLEHEPTSTVSGILPLDHILQTITESRPLARTQGSQPVIEITSSASGGGATHQIYHLVSLAVLNGSHGGQHKCAVIVDTDGTFSISRLVQQIKQMPNSSGCEAGLGDSDLLAALKHVHIYRPQSLASTVATLSSLTDHLFDSQRHNSFDRAVGFIALDSASSFYWQDKAEAEDAAFFASTSGSKAKQQQQPSRYTQLAGAVKAACKALNCPAIVTSWHLGPTTSGTHGQDARSLRPTLPPPWPTLPTVRFVVQRVPVRKFPPGVSVQEAMREAADRQKAVDAGTFECYVNEWNVDERTLQAVQNVGAGFGFGITSEGLYMEKERPE